MRRRVAGLTPQSSVAPQSISIFRQSYHQRSRKQQAPNPHFSQGQLICGGYWWIGTRRRGPWHQRRWRRFCHRGRSGCPHRAAARSLRLSEVTTKRGLASPCVHSALATTRRLRREMSSVLHWERPAEDSGQPANFWIVWKRCGRPPMVDLPQSRPVQRGLSCRH